MLVDFKRTILDIHGKPILKDGMKAEDENAVFTLKDAAINSLLLTYPDEPGIAGVEKTNRFKLAMKIENDQMLPIELTVEEIAQIKNLIGKAYTVTIVGRASALLDNPAKAE